MQKAKVTRPAKALGHHMLYDQPQEGSPAGLYVRFLTARSVAPREVAVSLPANCINIYIQWTFFQPTPLISFQTVGWWQRKH